MSSVLGVNTKEPLTDTERSVLELVLLYLRDARQKRESGSLMIKCDLSDGGVVKKWVDRNYIVR
jgi:hypothetical protein